MTSYAELQQQVLDAIKDPSENSLFNQDQMKNITQTIDDRIKKLFAQTKNPDIEDAFGQKLVAGISTKDLVITALGASVSGAVGGVVGSFVPSNLGLGIGGANAIIGGVLARRFIAKTGMPARFTEGVIIGGVSTALAGLGLSAQVGNVFGAFGGAKPTAPSMPAQTGDTPQTMALRGEVGSAIPAGFTE